MPAISGLLETSLYVVELDRVSRFYRDVLGLKPIFESERLIAHDAGSRGVLLLFRKGSTSADVATPGGMIPGHEGEGRLHLAFAVAAGDYEPWRLRLAEAGISLTGEMVWPRGGRSLYFDDPAGNVVELATPGLWANY